MPSSIDTSGPQRLLSTIYRQSWPPPVKNDTRNNEQPSENKFIAGNLWKGGSTFQVGTSSSATRPFSASLISSRREKKGRLMSGRREETKSASSNEGKGSIKRSTSRRRSYTKSKIPEYDGNKVLTDNQENRNKSLAVEYLAMLSGRNYLKKQYREHYWDSAEVQGTKNLPRSSSSQRPKTILLYPDLGSVIGSPSTSYIFGKSITASSVTKPLRSNTPNRVSPPATDSPPPKTDSSESTTPENARCNDAIISENKSKIADVTFTVKRSWSNVSTGKCYRVLSQPNDTLASLCLEGRPVSRKSNSRTSSMSSTNSFGNLMTRCRALSSTGNSTPSTSSETINGQPHGEEEIAVANESISASQMNTRPVEKNESDPEARVHGLPESVFYDDDEENIRCCESEYGDEEEVEQSEDVAIEKNVMSYSDLEESDMSENEADDYDERDVDEGEVNRRLQQVSAVFISSQSDEVATNCEQDGVQLALPSNKYEEDNSSESDTVWSEDENHLDPKSSKPVCKYQFADVLPPPYNEYNLKDLAHLPPDVNWRNFLDPPGGFSKQNIRSTNNKLSGDAPSKRNNSEHQKLTKKTRERIVKENKNFENTMDRLIMMEKMQAVTVQYEKDRKRHYMHMQNRPKSRGGSSKPTPSGNSASTTPTGEVRPQSAKAIPRRPSTANVSNSSPVPAASKPRKSVSSSELRIDGVGEKSPKNIELVRLSCTKNYLQYVHHSKRRRPSSAMPRFYEYSWSERQPVGKRPSFISLSYNKPRSCPSCRESEKRLTQLHITQMMLGRPRTSFSAFSSQQQKLHQRPSTTNGAFMKSQNNIQRLKRENSVIEETPFSKDNSNANRQRPKTAVPSRSGSISTTFGHAAPSSSGPVNRDAKEKIIAARAILATVTREYARAGGSRQKSTRVGPTPFSLPNGQQVPAPNYDRYRRTCRVLRPHVIDYTKMRLR